MQKTLILSFLLSMISLSLLAQEQINWLSWEEALEKQKEERKKILVDVYTDWCTWCKKMDSRTFQKPNIVKYVNENYYAVKFNAEQKDEIIFDNKSFSYVSGFGKRGYHELAAEIMNGRMSYPTVVFIDEQLEVIQPIPGFQTSRTFETIINYFAGNYYLNTPWHRFEENFRPGAPYTDPVLTPQSFQPTVQPVKNR